MLKRGLRTILCVLLVTLALVYTVASPRGRCYLDWLQERLPSSTVSTRTTIFFSNGLIS